MLDTAAIRDNDSDYLALREQLDAAQTALVDAETVKLERDTLRDKIADYEQTCGDLCPTCGWRGLRGDPGECAFCGNAELSARAHNAERKIAKLAEAERLLWECLAADNLPVEAECGLPCELAASIKAYLAGVQHG